MKKAFWSAARSTTVPQWQRAMQHLRELNETAWKDMMDLSPGMWTKSHYRTETQCDLQVNNMCEACNSAILEWRDKPIITLLEGLKYYLTSRIVTQKSMMQKYDGMITPRIQKVIETNKKLSQSWQPHWHGDDDHHAIFTVDNGNMKYEVNLMEKKCASRKWELSCIPCPHAVACIWHNRVDTEEFVASFYRKSTFLLTYSHLILPSNGPQHWPVVDTYPNLPPAMRRAPGRPKKQMNKSADEPKDPTKLGRTFPSVICKKCGKTGHNVRICKGKTQADREIPRGENERKKMPIKKRAIRTSAANQDAATQEPQVV